VGSATAAEPRPTRRIGRYEITGRIGRGGMGMVYRGLDAVLDREAAVKTLNVEGTLDTESRRRFEVEARAAARLQHPNIVTVYELGEDRSVPFIAMELLQGADLESVMRSGLPLSVHEILDVVMQVARGLAYAHEHGIVHRDIKPTNIRLLDEGGVKIMDFGIAKLGGTNLTQSGMMVGTVYYMSPEQIRAKPLDGRSDVFSLGVILHELLSGRRPFAGETTTQVLYKIVHEDAPRLEVELGSASSLLKDLVAKALARDLAARFESAARLADALRDALDTHLRGDPPGTTAEDLEAVAQSRLALRAGRRDEARRLLDDVLGRRPGCVEARRALRAVSRPPRSVESDAFTELDATFQSPQTRQPAATGVVAAPTAQYPPTLPMAARPRPRPASRGLLLGGAAGLLAVALGAAALLLRGTPAPQPAGPSGPPAPSVAVAAPAPVPVTEPESRAAAPAAHPTNRPAATLVMSAAPSLAAAPAPTPAPAPTLAPAASRPPVTTQAAAVPVAPPAPVPTGTVNVHSAYPVDVAWQGRVLAKAELAAQLQVPAGRQTLSLVSDTYFLRRTVSVDVLTGSATSIDAPELGKLSIKANPDNCEVSIDGVFADYPPILDRSVVAGTHLVTFKWPDGLRREESVEVVPGRPAYVTGRRD
jgi:eukaryotic-like serine/threonine-protein kinase